MQLADYLKKHDISDVEFGVTVGVDRTTVMRWRLGVVRPDWDSLWKIGEVTGGKVTADDFVTKPKKRRA